MEPATSAPGNPTPTIRIFISSPGDVATERDRAKDIIENLGRWYGAAVTLKPVLWEELPLQAAGTFQDQIDVVAANVDIAVFIVWSKIGTPVIVAGKRYQSGTEREFDLMLRTLEDTQGDRPDILFYFRRDDRGFDDRLQEADDDGKLALIEQKKLAAAFIQEHFWSEQGNVRAYHSFQRPVDFAGRLKVHLRGLIDQRLDSAGVSPHIDWNDAPYRGLEVFDYDHAKIFFGREQEVADLEQRLRDRHRDIVGVASSRPGTGGESLGAWKPPLHHAFVAVIGASGSGKSSLVRSGLRSSLIDGNVDPSIHEWRTVVLIPGQTGGQLVHGLVQAIATTDGALPELKDGGVPMKTLAQNLGTNPQSTVDLVFRPAFLRASGSGSQPRTKNEEPTTRLLVVIDQFEELFTDNQIGEADREAFLRALEALAQSGWCWVVATMRSDFYPLAQRSETFLRMKGETGQFDLLPPKPDALYRIITEPARLAGQTFEKRDPAHGGQSLSGKILEDAQKQPDTLPLLSDLLLELYLRRTPQNILTFAAYEELGGLEGALTLRAEKAFTALTPEQQAACPDLLHALVAVEANSDAFAVRRRANKAHLGDTPAKAGLIDAFIAARLLTASGDTSEATASLAHEALLRKWERIANWIRENRQHLQIRSRVEQAQKRWEAEKRREDLLLAEGLPLEEGLSLLQDAPQLVGGAEYAGTRDYVGASDAFVKARIDAAEAERTRQEAEKEQLRQQELRATRRAARNARVGLFVAMVLLASAGVAVIVARTQSSRAEKQKREAYLNAGRATLLRARELSQEGNHLYAGLHAAQALGFRGFGKAKESNEFPELISADSHPIETHLALGLIKQMPLMAWSIGGCDVIAWSPDGNHLVGMNGNEINVWDPASGRLLKRISIEWPSESHSNPYSQTLPRVRWGRDPNVVIIAEDGVSLVSVVNVATGVQRSVPLPGEDLSVLTLDRSGHVILGAKDGEDSKAVRGFQITSWQKTFELALNNAPYPLPATAASFSNGGSELAIGYQDGTLEVWRAHGLPGDEDVLPDALVAPVKFEMALRKSMFNDHPVSGLEWSPSGDVLACLSDREVKIHVKGDPEREIDDVVEGSDNRFIKTWGDGGLTQAMWSRDGSLLAIASGSSIVRVFEPDQGFYAWKHVCGWPHKADYKFMEVTRVAGSCRVSIAWSPDGRLLAVTCDGRLYLWAIPLSSHVFPAHPDLYSLVEQQVFTFGGVHVFVDNDGMAAANDLVASPFDHIEDDHRIRWSSSEFFDDGEVAPDSQRGERMDFEYHNRNVPPDFFRDRFARIGYLEEFGELADSISTNGSASATSLIAAGWHFLGFGEESRALNLFEQAQSRLDELSEEMSIAVMFEAMTEDLAHPGDDPKLEGAEQLSLIAELRSQKIEEQLHEWLPKLLAGLAAAQWATGAKEVATSNYLLAIGLDAETFPKDQEPTPPYTILDPLDQPVVIPALMEVYESARARLRSEERIQMNAPPAASEPAPSAAGPVTPESALGPGR
jgi:WD40 repeat protein